MILSIWRYSHLVLAISSALFLLLASLTGAILAFEPISHSLRPYGDAKIDEVFVGETIHKLQTNYDEVLELEVTASDFVIASVVTNEGIAERIYINPVTGENLGIVEKRAPLFSTVTHLHRSLFLKSTGRFFVGLASLLLCLIAITGLLLLAQRQGGILKLFTKVQDTDFAQRYHILWGKWLFVPILILSVTGVYLSAEKFSLLPQTGIEHNWSALPSGKLENRPVKDFEVFKEIRLNDLRNLTFPFSDDPEDHYQMALRNRELLVHQYTGEVISEVSYPFVRLASLLSMRLHTGEGSVLWSMILLISSLGIPFFIYSGFSMTLKRRRRTKKAIPKYHKDECGYIILVGSETGTTFEMGTALYNAMIEAGVSVYLSSLNEYSTYKEARHLIILTATYGDGDAPGNARNFERLFKNTIPLNPLKYTVVGFGSLGYTHYCGFAIKVDKLLQDHSAYTPVLPLVKINECSENAFKHWIREWNGKVGVNVSLELPLIRKKEQEHKFEVLECTPVNSDATFLLRLKSKNNIAFQSGDLIGIRPGEEERERQYSIAKTNGDMVLSIKKHEKGVCSSYLSTLKTGVEFKGRIERNGKFHFPKKAPSLVFIANGTGIAPFLGMMAENKANTPIYVFWGGRTKKSFALYREYVENALLKKQIRTCQIGYSREGEKQYVQDLLLIKKELIGQVLEEGGTVMICGSLAMQQGVLDVLEKIARNELQCPLSEFENRGQLALDCY